MAKEKKEPSLPATNTGIVPKSLVPEITRAVGTLLGPPVVELAQRLGVSIEDTVRFRAVTRECIRSRELARLSVRDVATGFALRNIVSPTSNRATSSESSPRCFGNTSACWASLAGMPSGLV